jgi:chromosome partitioning protein
VAEWREGRMPRAKILSFINYKGGVAKTTSTYHVGCSLAQHRGKKVLLVDIDPQRNLTFLCAAVEKWQDFKRRKVTIATMYQRYLEKKAIDTKAFIWRAPISSGTRRIGDLDLIPCDIDLLGEDLGGGQITGTFPGLELLKRQAGEYLRDRMFMRKALKEVEDEYDFILIDCPPNLYLMTQNALAASKWYIVTSIPDHLSTIGLSILHQKVQKIGSLLKSAQTFAGGSDIGIKVADRGGVIFVRVRIGGRNLTNMHFETMNRVRQLLGDGACFEDWTPELIGYSEAAENSVPVWMLQTQAAERAAGKHEYERITQEFLKRF